MSLRKCFNSIILCMFLSISLNAWASADNSQYLGVKMPSGSGTWMIQRFDTIYENISNYYLSSLGFGDSGTGTIQSPEFKISTSIIKLRIRGYSNNHLNTVDLVDVENGQVLRNAAPPGTDGPNDYSWDVADLTGKRVYVRLVDRDSSGWAAWLGLDELDAGKRFRVRFSEDLSTKGWKSSALEPKLTKCEGVPFLAQPGSPVPPNGKFKVEIGCKAQRLLLLGMTNSFDVGVTIFAGADATEVNNRFWVGDKLGEVRVRYADGVSETYPLILGESLWWGKKFYEFQEPFISYDDAKTALVDALNVFPPRPVQDGRYIAFIKPRPQSIASVEVVDTPKKGGVPVILGITVEAEPGENVPDHLTALPREDESRELTEFLATKPLRQLGNNEAQAKAKQDALIQALFQTESDIAKGTQLDMPVGYHGPVVSFKGNVYAEVLTNIFHHNVNDIEAKITPDGMYHTSTENAPTWGTYAGFGSFKKDYNTYYGHSWSRDLGRAMQEITILGSLDKARTVADYALRCNNLWEEKAAELSEDGHSYPAHASRIMNTPSLTFGNFENDGHGLVTMFIYKLWQRLPDRDEWLKTRWNDIRKLGDWVTWQFENPDISGAKDGLLRTDSECSGGVGYSVYADAVCMESLNALSEMAQSIGKKATAAKWKRTAEAMRNAINSGYIVDDKKHGKIWTRKDTGWPHKSTVLGPLMFLADRRGFTPEDDTLGWRAIDSATYQGLVDRFKPFGFYGVMMGYGQGFFTESALLLDRMSDAAQMLEWTAKCTYNPRYQPYIVPEGCELHPSGKFWRRIGDLGNGVQEAEIIKALRLVIGVDDNNPRKLQIAPRMPLGWMEISISKYPALIEVGGKPEMANLAYKLTSTAKGAQIEVTSDRALGNVTLRLGVGSKRPSGKALVNGQRVDAAVSKSGDSWWIRVSVPAGSSRISVESL